MKAQYEAPPAILNRRAVDDLFASKSVSVGTDLGQPNADFPSPMVIFIRGTKEREFDMRTLIMILMTTLTPLRRC